MNAKKDRQLEGRSRFSPTILIFLSLISTTGYAASQYVDDISTFGLLDVSARFSVNYNFDDRKFDSMDGPDRFETRTTWEEEFFLMTKSFVYHPGFLNIDFGGGLLLVQQDFDSDLGAAKTDETLLNFVTRLNFLELKPYPFSLYYERSHPPITTSLSGRYLTQDDTYGLTGQVLDIWDSTALRYNLRGQTIEGSGFGAVVDENVDTRSFSTSTSYRGGDQLVLAYSSSDRESNSGSLGLPIQNSKVSQDSSEIRSTNAFGKQRQFDVLQVLRRFRQSFDTGTKSSVDNRQYMSNLRWQHTKNTRSSFDYRVYDSHRTGFDSKKQDLKIGFVQRLTKRFIYNGNFNHEALQQVGFKRDRSAITGAFTYSHDFGSGTAGLAGSLRSSRTDQESSEAVIQVFDERVTLIGTITVTLLNEFVVSSSVVVKNTAMSQEFVEGFDYRLVTIGSATSVQRLLGGNIADGQTVLVDYSYETSGTAKYDGLNSNISLNVNFRGGMDAYVRYGKQDTTVQHGLLTNPLNDFETLELGVGGSYSLRNGWVIRGQIRHVDRNETISPQISDSVSLSLNANVRGTWTLSLSGALTQVDNKNSVEDVDLSNFRLGLRGRVPGGGQISYEASYFDDIGGSLPRNRWMQRLMFQWNYRQVRFVFRAQDSDETLGTTGKENKQVTAQVIRMF